MAIFAVIACMRYDIAIPFAENDKEARSLFSLSFVIGIIVATIIMIAALAIPEIEVFDEINNKYANGHLILVAFGTFFSCFFSILQNWYTRLSKFTLIASTKFVQSPVSGLHN